MNRSLETSKMGGEKYLDIFQVASIGFVSNNEITLNADPAYGFLSIWEIWMNGVFSEVLVPSFISSYMAVLEPEIKWAIEADERLNLLLNDKQIEGSLQAGDEIFSGFEGAKHLGVPARYRQLVRQKNIDENLGHFTVALALRCSAFNISPIVGLYGLCYSEWMGACANYTEYKSRSSFLLNTESCLEGCVSKVVESEVLLCKKRKKLLSQSLQRK